MLTRPAAALLCLALLTACGSDSDAETSATDAASAASETATDRPTPDTTKATTRPTKVEPKPGTRIVVDDSDFGPMLFDNAGQAIYLFDQEPTSEPQCYDDCAEAWPPVVTKGKPVAGKGVDEALLGTVKRRDGSRQVTYNDHPLYFYAHEAPREVKCHDVFLNGGTWYVVQPGGDAAPPG